MSSAVKKRHVFYLSGFDPRGPAFYCRLYQDEAQKQSAINAMTQTVSERLRRSRLHTSWQIKARVAECEVDTEYEFLRWDDLVRQYWQRNELLVIWHYLQVAWFCLWGGVFHRILQTAWPPLVTATFPLALLLLCLVLAISSGWGVYSVLGSLGFSTGVRVMVGMVAGAAVLHAGRVLERRLNSYWLLRIYAFTRKQGLASLPELDERIDFFAQRILAQAKQTGIDEILVVGHSTGSMIAISALSRAVLLKPDLATCGPRISLMTLGHCIPILSFLPSAQRFRTELATVANTPGIDWVDFTAPSDGACFALIDPVAVSGIVRLPRDEPSPKVLSPRFATLFTPETYRVMKRDWYRHHFQYLMAGEKPGDYDYFAITAGNVTLGDRYKAHSSVTDFTGLRILS